MDETASPDGESTAVGWRRIPPGSVSSPITQTVPYLELKLEHPDLEPWGHGDRFFPDIVPYELDGVPRIFYWRPTLQPSVGEPDTWELACATTHELVGIDSLPADKPPLVTVGATGTTLVVDGTIGGSVMTSHVASYTEPTITIDQTLDSGLELTVAGTDYSIATGDRRRICLPEQRVEPVDAELTTVVPELVVRYPGRRELHHPARGATYRLFPSFDLDIDAVPNPLPVPTTVDELDDAALATDLGVDLSQRPYPERALWQAFAYTAFDPHADLTPKLAQLETGHIVLQTGEFRDEASNTLWRNR
jgi:hypothetical protein